MSRKVKDKAQSVTEFGSVLQHMLEVAKLELGRDKARYTVHKSEKICRALVENSLGLMCIHDLIGDLLYINPAAARSLGYDCEDALGRNLKLFLAPSVQHEFDGYLERIRKHGSDSGFMRLVAKDGAERVWLYRNLIHHEEGMTRCVLGHAQDVTPWIRTEQALKESERRFRTMADHAPVMIWMTDAGGNFTFFNKQWLAFTARSMEQATAARSAK